MSPNRQLQYIEVNVQHVTVSQYCSRLTCVGRATIQGVSTITSANTPGPLSLITHR